MTAQAAAPAGFTLPGPPCDRETAAGWTRWRLTRHGFIPAPVVTIAEWRAMSPRSRQLHDLHRAATHASLAFQETPMARYRALLARYRAPSQLPRWPGIQVHFVAHLVTSVTVAINDRNPDRSIEDLTP